MKNVILISFDAFRADCFGNFPNKRQLSLYGLTPFLKTPNLNKLIEKGTFFSQVFSTNSYTTSAHASVFTGKYPPKHGVRRFFAKKTDSLKKNIPTLADIFSQKGWETIFYSDVPELFNVLNIDRGFKNKLKNYEQVFEKLENPGKKPFFMFLHLYDTHEPYLYSEIPKTPLDNQDYFQMLEAWFKTYQIKPPSIFWQRKPHNSWKYLFNKIGNRDIRRMLPMYVFGVNKFDQKRLKRLKISLMKFRENKQVDIIIFADHGEGQVSLDSPLEFGHCGELFDSVINVPLLIISNELKHGINKNLLSNKDIFNIILELANLNKFSYIKNGKYTLEQKCTYSEFWTLDKSYSISDDSQGNAKVPFVHINKPLNWLLRQRCFRTKNKKYIINGNLDYFNKIDLKKYADRKYIKQLYRCFFYRFEDKSGLETYTKLIKKTKITRQKLLEIFKNSNEGKQKKHFTVVNLKTSPDEQFQQKTNRKSFVSKNFINSLKLKKCFAG